MELIKLFEGEFEIKDLPYTLFQPFVHIEKL